MDICKLYYVNTWQLTSSSLSFTSLHVTQMILFTVSGMVVEDFQSLYIIVMIHSEVIPYWLN